MIIIEKYELLLKHLSNLKETSKDDHGDGKTYMTSCEYPAVNFDEVKDEYITGLHISGNPRSNDALLVTKDNKSFFIEFKNGYMDNKKIFDVKGKIYESLPILTDIIGKGISYTRNELVYILVYNGAKNDPSTDIKKHIASKAKAELIRFDLERFKNFFFKEVHTYTETEFDNFLIENNII